MSIRALLLDIFAEGAEEGDHRKDRYAGCESPALLMREMQSDKYISGYAVALRRTIAEIIAIIIP